MIWSQIEENARAKHGGVSRTARLQYAAEKEKQRLHEEAVKQHEANEQVIMENKQTYVTEQLAKQKTRPMIRKRNFAHKAAQQIKLTEQLYMDTFCGIFFESLMLDEYVKQNNKRAFYKLAESNILSLMEERNMTFKDIKRNSSTHVQKLMSLCEDLAKQDIENKFDIDINKEVEPINERISESERFKMRNRLRGQYFEEGQYDIESISTAVQDKVLRVIKKETTMDEKDKEENAEIAQHMPDTQPNGMGAGMPEPDVIDGDEQTGTTDANTNPNEPETNNVTESFLGMPRYVKRKPIREESIFKALLYNASKRQILNESGQVNMDECFAKAIAEYTLLETLHTSKIVEFTPHDLRVMSKQLIGNEIVRCY